MKSPIPDAALAQHVIALGKTGAGKSSVMRGLVEGLFDRGSPICIIDPKGDWWGIKASGDGKKPGLPFVIFGGEHADVPLTPLSGASVAELIATGNRPSLIDLGGWMVGERTRFFVEFASNFFRHARGARYLVIDEVHNFAPQGKVMDPDAGKMLHWANRLASEGRGKGITILAASQRPQKVHKDFVTSCETLIAMKVIHKLDRDAIKDWIDGCGDPTRGKEVLNSLASLKRGSGWVWSPEIEFGPEIVHFPLFKTYDSFKPQAPDTGRLKGWAEVNLDEVRAKLKTAIAAAEAKDPRMLQKRIADLEQQLRGKPGAPAAISREDLQAAEQRGLERGRASASQELQRAIAVLLKTLKNAAHQAIEQTFSSSTVPQVAIAASATAAPSPSFLPGKNRVITRLKPVQENGHAAPQGDLTGPEQRIVDAIAWLESLGIDPCEQTAVAFLANYTYGGGAFNNPRGRLNQRGLVEYVGDKIRLTDTGRAVANPPESALTNDELHSRVLARLPGPEQRLLKPLIEAHPKPMSNEDLAAAANYAAGAGSFNNPRGRLKSLGLVEYLGGGQVKAADLLFPSAL